MVNKKLTPPTSAASADSGVASKPRSRRNSGDARSFRLPVSAARLQPTLEEIAAGAVLDLDDPKIGIELGLAR